MVTHELIILYIFEWNYNIYVIQYNLLQMSILVLEVQKRRLRILRTRHNRMHIFSFINYWLVYTMYLCGWVLVSVIVCYNVHVYAVWYAVWAPTPDSIIRILQGMAWRGLKHSSISTWLRDAVYILFIPSSALDAWFSKCTMNISFFIFQFCSDACLSDFLNPFPFCHALPRSATLSKYHYYYY